MPVRTTTTDDGTEFATHPIIATELKVDVYFAHPYSLLRKRNRQGHERTYSVYPKENRLQEDNKWTYQTSYLKNNRTRKKNEFVKPKDIIKERIA